MDERVIRTRFRKALERYGYFPITNTDAVKCGNCGGLYYPEKGRPDCLVFHPNAPGIFLETKRMTWPINKSFAFSEITEEQRTYLDRRTEQGYRCYIGLGVVHKREGKRDELLDLFLVDWYFWKRTEELFEGIQKSIPYLPYKGMRRALDSSYCMTKVFGLHRLENEDIPHFHSARRNGEKKPNEHSG